MQFGIHNYAEIISAIICTACYLHKPSFFNRWFMPFLWLTVAVELTGKATSDYPAFKIPMYNLFNGVEFIFYLGIFFLLNKKNRNKNMILSLIGVFLLFFLINLLLLQGFWIYNNQTTTVGSILLIIVCLSEYLRMLSATETAETELKWPVLCIATGLFIFYTGNFVNNALMDYMVKNDPKGARMLYKVINNNLNVILYSLFSIGFIIESIRSQAVSLKA